MITVTHNTILKLQQTILDLCFKRKFGLGKTSGQLLEWCYYNNFGFTLTVSADESGNIVPSVEPGWHQEGTEIVQVRGFKFFLDMASADMVKGGELDYCDEPGGGFCLGKCGREVCTVEP